ncbi:MAG: hypothetical protein R2911_32230 [Caldilineaceae bacterium]
MKPITDAQARTQTSPGRTLWLEAAAASIFYYPQFLYYVFWSSHLAKQGRYGSEEWWHSSLGSMLALETVGVQTAVTALAKWKKWTAPAFSLPTI